MWLLSSFSWGWLLHSFGCGFFLHSARGGIFLHSVRGGFFLHSVGYGFFLHSAGGCFSLHSARSFFLQSVGGGFFLHTAIIQCQSSQSFYNPPGFHHRFHFLFCALCPFMSYSGMDTCLICVFALQLMKATSSTDTPLGTVTLLTEKQKAEKTPYVVLSGAGAKTSGL